MRALALAVLSVAMLAGQAAAQDHSHHMRAPSPPPQATTAAPDVPSPDAADRYFDPGEMARARALLRYENGGMSARAVRIDRLEVQAADGPDAYAWEGEAWFGGDLNRAVFKSSGDGEFGGALESGEIQALYSRAIDPWFDLQAGVRQDFGSDRPTTYLTLGVEGLAPYWFEVEGAVFLSHRGDAFARLEASQDFRLTQRLLLTPRAEVDLAFQDAPEQHIDAGFAEVALGLRLHYAVTPRVLPYVGVEWSRETARRHDGEDAEKTALIIGLRHAF